MVHPLPILLLPHPTGFNGRRLFETRPTLTTNAARHERKSARGKLHSAEFLTFVPVCAGNRLNASFAAHNNFSDSTLFAPGIMRKLKNAGKMDGVTFIDQVRGDKGVLCSMRLPSPLFWGINATISTQITLPAPGRDETNRRAFRFEEPKEGRVKRRAWRRQKEFFVAVESKAFPGYLCSPPRQENLRTVQLSTYSTYEGELPRTETPTETVRVVSPPPPPSMQVTRLTLCALEVFLRRRDASGGALDSPAPADLASAMVGSDLPVVFPEARVKRACARGVLPPTEVPSRDHGDGGSLSM